MGRVSSSSSPLFLATSWKDVLDGAHLRCGCSRASGGTRGSTSPSPRPSHATLRTAGSSGWAPGYGPLLGLSGEPHTAQSNPYCLCSLNDHQAPPALLPAVNPCNPDILQREKLRHPPQRPHNDQRCHMGNAGLWGTLSHRIQPKPLPGRRGPPTSSLSCTSLTRTRLFSFLPRHPALTHSPPTWMPLLLVVASSRDAPPTPPP